jgi:hypothetical protein
VLTESQIRGKVRTQIRSAFLRHQVQASKGLLEKKVSKKQTELSSGHRYSPANSTNMFLDREGNENEYEPRYLKKLSDYYKKMGLIREMTLPLARNLYGGIETSLMTSGFYKEDNEHTEGVPSHFLRVKEQTDAAMVAEKAISQLFIKIGVPIDVEVISIDETSIKDQNRDKLQNNNRPNRFVVAAQMAMTGEGKHPDRGVLLIFAVVSDEDFDMSLVDPSKMVSDISATIRHELMHDRQYDSLARDMGISRMEAKKKFEDWGLIPEEDEPRDRYLGSHIEIDAFGHEFAERLVSELGIDEAEKLVATGDISGMKKIAGKIGLGDNFTEYFEEYPDEKFTERLQKKIRKNLVTFRKEGVY